MIYVMKDLWPRRECLSTYSVLHWSSLSFVLKASMGLLIDFLLLFVVLFYLCEAASFFSIRGVLHISNYECIVSEAISSTTVYEMTKIIF